MRLAILILSAMLAVCSCTGGQKPDEGLDNPDPQPTELGFAKGADVSWLTQLESEGYTFTDAKGVQTECMQLLKDQ